jgi:multisubunit Na+/H+ antiporter MnhB subunit
MYKTLSDPVKAIVFYAIAFGLELAVAVALAPVIGELAVLIGMFTPTIAALLMLLIVTREGYTRAGWVRRWIALAILALVVCLTAAAAGAAPTPAAPAGPDFATIDAYVAAEIRQQRIPGLALGIV